MINNPPKILVIKSEISELTKVQSLVNEVFVYYDIDQKYFNKVFLCFSEAVVNCIIHGNRHDRNKEVFINVDCITNLLDVKIVDEGDGFDINELPNPTIKENILKESGRGIFIIKSLAQFIEFNNRGNGIRFKIDCK